MKNRLNNNFYKSMLVIALPVVFQNLISISVNLVSSIMLGKLGVNQLAGVGIANRVFFIYTYACLGIYSGSSIFIAQYWGAKDYKSIKKIFGMNLFLGLVLSLSVTVLAYIFAPQIISIFNKDVDVVVYGVTYLRIICFTYAFTALSFASSFNSRAVRKLKVPTLISLITVCISIILNYLLIFGKAGFPELGIKGAAIGTAIARTFEFIMAYSYIFFSKNHPLAGTIKEYMSWNFNMFKSTLKTSLPVIISETSFALGYTVYYIAYGMIGASAIAVAQVAYVINDLFQAVFVGLSNASAVMTGNELGKNEVKKALDYSKINIKICLFLSLIMSTSLLFAKQSIIGIYNFDANTNLLLNKSLVIFAIFLTPRMVTYLIGSGVLRAGGDTRFCMFLDLVVIWLIGVPLAFFAVKVLQLPINYVFVFVFCGEVVKMSVVSLRYKSQKWINNLIA